MIRAVPLTKTMVQVATIAAICLGVFAFVLVTVNADTHLSPYTTYAPTLQATRGAQTANGFLDDGYSFTITGTGWDPAADGYDVYFDCPPIQGQAACPQYVCTPGLSPARTMVCDPKFYPIMKSDGSFSFPLFLQQATPGPYKISAQQRTNCNSVGTQCTSVTASTTITIPVAGAYTKAETTGGGTALSQSKLTTTTDLGMYIAGTWAAEGIVAAAIGGLGSVGVARVISRLKNPTEQSTDNSTVPGSEEQPQPPEKASTSGPNMPPKPPEQPRGFGVPPPGKENAWWYKPVTPDMSLEDQRLRIRLQMRDWLEQHGMEWQYIPPHDGAPGQQLAVEKYMKCANPNCSDKLIPREGLAFVPRLGESSSVGKSVYPLLDYGLEKIGAPRGLMHGGQIICPHCGMQQNYVPPRRYTISDGWIQ
jgi:hypothetical protein